MTHTLQIGPHRLEAGRDGRRAAVDRVHAVRVHVVREAAGAADARDEHDLLARDAEGRHHFFHLRENRVVAAAGAPTDILVAGEIGGFQDGKWEVNAHGVCSAYCNMLNCSVVIEDGETRRWGDEEIRLVNDLTALPVSLSPCS